MAALIEGHDVEPIHERPGYTVEPVSVGGASVQQAQSRATGLTPFESVKRDFTGVERPMTRGRAGEWLIVHRVIVLISPR